MSVSSVILSAECGAAGGIIAPLSTTSRWRAASSAERFIVNNGVANNRIC